MKKGKFKKNSLLICFFLIIISLIIFVSSADIRTYDSEGFLSNTFSTTESVYVLSDPKLCNELIGKTINLFVVEKGSTELKDVRGSFQEVNLSNNYAISSKINIWETPVKGEYDVIIDCEKNEVYNPLGPKATFNVIVKKGSGSAGIGEKNIGDHAWMYDPENPNFINEMMQIKISAFEEDIQLKNITVISSEGDYSKIKKLEVYIDENDNGKLDNDTLIGSSEPAYETRSRVISMDYTLNINSSKNILIVYTMPEIDSGKFGLEVNSIYGTGKDSEGTISFLGLPLESGITNVLSAKKCIGILVLQLSSNLATKDSIVKAKVSNVDWCDDKKVIFKTEQCTSSEGEIDSCFLKNNQCEIEIKAIENKTYYACLDKNNNGNMGDDGESALSQLVVVEKSTGKKQVSAEENKTEEKEVVENKTEEKTSIPVTGGFAADLKSTFLGSGGLIFVLEVTLVLILVVLVLIFVRLKAPRKEIIEQQQNPGFEDKKKELKKKREDSF